mmetsp:Transcript_4654/g.14537  ORF Transcript_4654/g.14537 Transcript_4654/m.14537 type:complete len:234 (+) Transcript_4654:40-741(+)
MMASSTKTRATPSPEKCQTVRETSARTERSICQRKASSHNFLETLDPNLALRTTSWLYSTATTKLRAASRTCKALFVRNSPVSREGFVFFELLETDDDSDLSRLRVLLRVPKANPESPLLAWRLLPLSRQTCNDIRMLAPRLWTCREFVRAAVSQFGRSLRYADARLKSDRGIVLRAVARHVSAFQFAHEILKSDRDFVLAAVAQSGEARRQADEPTCHLLPAAPWSSSRPRL